MIPDLSEMPPDELRAIMRRLNLNQYTLASRIGVTQSSVSLWLSGKVQPMPPIRALIRLLTPDNE